ncbi:hypothetical protein ABN763_09730 [Spongiivirga sp. MCCC 1A20706]|uniref:hypothetical protein n=1 Tax=Spongiivirga sp. MCCC 1A20706 TaxID=3160963 RepID=UPI003977B5E0
MKKTLFVCCSMFISLALQAQYSGQVATNLSSGGSSQGTTAAAITQFLGPVNQALNKRTFRAEDFQGSPYTNNEFQSTILSYEGEKVGTIFYRYNALNEEVEIKQNNLPTEGIRALGRDKKINIIVENKPMSFKTFVDKKNNTLNGYLISLVNGKKYELFKRINVKFTEGSASPNSFVKASPSRFSHFIEYYIQEKGVNRIDEIPLKNRKMVALLKNKEDGLKSYLSDNKLDISKENDLIKVVNHLNQ